MSALTSSRLDDISDIVTYTVMITIYIYIFFFLGGGDSFLKVTGMLVGN